MNEIEQIGQFIRIKRKEKGMTQVELAEQSLTTQKSISRIETGKDNASFFTILTILKALGLQLLVNDYKKTKIQTHCQEALCLDDRSAEKEKE